MYALYRKTGTSQGVSYEFDRTVSLFGCNSGLIPKMLRAIATPDKGEPSWYWHLTPEEHLTGLGLPENGTLIINLKPNNAEKNLSLYEIGEVWGHSGSGWTPIMLRLRGLFIDEDPKKFDDKSFSRKEEDIDDPIFSILYLNGSVAEGTLTGKWTAPRASPTNSALLWPNTFKYFVEEAEKVLTRLKHG